MNVLITGGTGFVGYWLNQTKPEGIHTRHLNRYEYETCHWEWYDWDAVIHCANVSPLRVIQNHKGKLLYISSGAVYEGKNEYAENKRKWEKQLPKDAIIARLFTFIGEGLKTGYAITNFIQNAKQGKHLEIWGDGTTIRTYLHGFDLGTWLWKILLEGEGVYNVGSEVEYTIREVAELVSKVYNVPYEVLYDLTLQDRYVPDTTRARELGCEETIGLPDAIERTKHASS